MLGLVWPLSHVSAGTVLKAHEFAWSNNVGYINFGDLSVNDRLLQGTAWSESRGFIIFNPREGGVFNDGQGNLSGSAWGEQLGWIDFHNVHISVTGRFTGTATGALVGIITFDCPNFCDVQTDWRPTGSTPRTPRSTSPVNSPATLPALTDTSVAGPTVTEVAPLTPALFDVSSSPGSPSGTSRRAVWYAVLAGIFLAATGLIIFLTIQKIRARATTRKRMKTLEASQTQAPASLKKPSA